MTPEECLKHCRDATLKSNDGTPVLQLLSNELPVGYKLTERPNDGGHKYAIQTPSNDLICLVDADENSTVIKTSAVLNQDSLNVENQPSLANDELSKMARAFATSQNLADKICVQVHASNADIGL